MLKHIAHLEVALDYSRHLMSLDLFFMKLFVKIIFKWTKAIQSRGAV